VLTALLVIVIAVPVGIVIGGGLDFSGRGGSDDGAEVAVDAVGAETTTTSTTEPSSSTTSPSSSTTTAVPGRAPAQVKVRFANGSHKAGAAVTIGDGIGKLGYRVLAPAPSPKTPVPATLVTYRDGFEAEAAALVAALKVTGVTPSRGATGPADVDVLLADDAVAATAAAAGPG
jgi:hypothetical protein